MCRCNLRCGCYVLGSYHLRRFVYMPRHCNLRRPNLRTCTDMRWSADVRADGYLQLCSNMLEHLNLSGLDDLSGNCDLRSSGDLRRNPNLRRIHDMSANAGMRAAVVRLPVPW